MIGIPFVAQGAAPFAGPEAFSCRMFPHDLVRKTHLQLPQNPHLHKNTQGGGWHREHSFVDGIALAECDPSVFSPYLA